MKNPSKRPGASSAGRLEKEAIASLQDVLERSGWRSEPQGAGPGRPDVVLRRGSRILVIEVKAAPGRARRAVLRGHLADAVLHSKALARESNAEPVAILAASAISDDIAGELAQYMHQVAPGMSWGLLDERGRFELHGESFEGVRPVEQPPPHAYRSPRKPEIHNPFSDLGQWMLKLLLAERVSTNWLRAPRRSFHGVTELADAARVSPASASRFLAALEAEGYLAQSEIRLIRLPALLNAWQRSAQRPLEWRYARFLLPSSEPYRQLRSVVRKLESTSRSIENDSGESAASRVGPNGARCCLGLFAACRSLGVNVVRGAPLHLLCEDLSPEIFEALELVPVEHVSDSELVVVRPRFPESVFRACVSGDEAPAADILQCWLDVSFHAARGEEQATEIASRLGLENWDE